MAGTLHSDTYRIFLDALVQIRKDRGVTQAQIAQYLGKPQSWVSKTERGERRLDPIELCFVADAIGCVPEDLFALAIEASKSSKGG